MSRKVDRTMSTLFHLWRRRAVRRWHHHALVPCYKLNGRRSFGCTQTKLFDKGMYVWIAQRLKILTGFLNFDD